MQGISFPRLRPGQAPSASDYNRLVEAVEALANLTAVPPMEVIHTSGGYHVRLIDTSNPPILIRLTGQAWGDFPDAKYAGVEVNGDGTGGGIFPEASRGVVSTLNGSGEVNIPIWEANGNAYVPTDAFCQNPSGPGGTVVLAWPWAEAGTGVAYRFWYEEQYIDPVTVLVGNVYSGTDVPPYVLWLGHNPRNPGTVGNNGGAVQIGTGTAHNLGSATTAVVHVLGLPSANDLSTGVYEITVDDATHFTLTGTTYAGAEDVAWGPSSVNPAGTAAAGLSGLGGEFEVTTSTAHGLQGGDEVVIGESDGAVNGLYGGGYIVTVIDDTHFTLNGTTAPASITSQSFTWCYPAGGTGRPLDVVFVSFIDSVGSSKKAIVAALDLGYLPRNGQKLLLVSAHSGAADVAGGTLSLDPDTSLVNVAGTAKYLTTATGEAVNIGFDGGAIQSALLVYDADGNEWRVGPNTDTPTQVSDTNLTPSMAGQITLSQVARPSGSVFLYLNDTPLGYFSTSTGTPADGQHIDVSGTGYVPGDTFTAVYTS